MKKLAFVTPWYGEDISGGAETALRGLVHHLQAAGTDLEVLTTCVKDFRSDWNIDFHPAGLSDCAGIPVRRFPVRRRDTGAFDRINQKLMAGQPITAREERTFMEEMVNSPELYRYIGEHKAEYSLFVFTPYMFGTTYYGVQQCYEKAVLIPCLHDEPYAHMDVFRQVFSRAAGMIFLSRPEQALAESLYGVRGPAFQSLGTGLDTAFTGDGARFCKKYGIDAPFLLYAGRKDHGKKADELARFFLYYKKRRPGALKLVMIGPGTLGATSGDIVDLGFVPLQDKYDAYAAAAVFCNPSQFESFSIVIMESWLSGVPVLVNGECAVTRDFAVQARGGLYYNGYAEFEGCLEYLFSHPDVARQMAQNGGAYVRQHFSWDAIVEKYTRYFRAAGGDAHEG